MKKKNYSVTIKYLLDGNAETFNETITGATAETIVAQANREDDLEFDLDGQYAGHYIIPWSSIVALKIETELVEVEPKQDGICSETNTYLMNCKDVTIAKGGDLPSASDFIGVIYDERGNEVTSGYEAEASGIPANSNTAGVSDISLTVTIGEETLSCDAKLTITEA